MKGYSALSATARRASRGRTAGRFARLPADPPRAAARGRRPPACPASGRGSARRSTRGWGVRRRRRSVGLQRERHEPEYLIILAVVALTAVGILMVYSTSADAARTSRRRDTFAIVGPQLVWAVLGIVALVVTMQLDYRWLAPPVHPVCILAAVALLVLVLLPGVGVTVGGSARWLQIGPAAGGPPGRVRQARAGRLPGPLDGAPRHSRAGRCDTARCRSC